MGTKRFQVLSEGSRVQAVIDMPDQGESWPLVILNHPALRPKDGAFFDALVPLLLERGIAACRYDPRGYGASEGSAASMSFWTRWLDLTAITMHAGDDLQFDKIGMAGMGFGAVLTLWWGAVHPIAAVVGLGLPAAKKLGSIPRPMQNLLPPDLEENAVIPHPAGVANGLLLYGEKDKEAERAQTPEGNLGLAVETVAGADKSFTQLKARQDAFVRTADWFARYLLKQEAPVHDHQRTEAGREPMESVQTDLPEEPAQE